jgi:galactokinase/mevalonate kinase-like predicted kinase
VQAEQSVLAQVGDYNNQLLKLKDLAKNMEDEQAILEQKFKEFGKRLDEAMIKKRPGSERI